MDPVASSSSLDRATKLAWDPGWVLRLYAEAGEASGSFRGHPRRTRPNNLGPSRNPERSAAEAGRRARGHVRRYCAANGLNRLGTLTYGGDGCHDPVQVRADVAAFFKELRAALDSEPFPYLWTTEWHKSGHGIHVHFAVGRFINWRLIRDTWRRGHVWINHLGLGRTRPAVLHEARITARYLAKYIGKDFNESGSGLHRYEVAEGFQPASREINAWSLEEVVAEASEIMGGAPDYQSTSDEWTDWYGPRAVYLSWK